jgi:hypothetical protein
MRSSAASISDALLRLLTLGFALSVIACNLPPPDKDAATRYDAYHFPDAGRRTEATPTHAKGR